MGDWREQESRNETVFREMNEWTEAANDERLGIERTIDIYLCECSNRRCSDPIQLTRNEYEEGRSGPVAFAIALNHENPEIDLVIAEYERFAVVEKFYGIAARVARETNPRR